VLAIKIPPDHVEASVQPRIIWHSLRKVFTHPAARLALSFGLSITLANEIVNITFGVWLGDTYQLQITSLGFFAVVIGAAELTGEALTALLVDRIGKKKSVRAGVVFTSLAALLLPVLGQSLWGAMAGLFLFYLGFEFTLVSFMPLVTEVLPEARATVMAANLASHSIGRALGAQLGLLFYALGFGANALAALAINAVAIIILSRIHIE
jgi:predicted MFS family arabinose efflux permease